MSKGHWVSEDSCARYLDAGRALRIGNRFSERDTFKMQYLAGLCTSPSVGRVDYVSTRTKVSPRPLSLCPWRTLKILAYRPGSPSVVAAEYFFEKFSVVASVNRLLRSDRPRSRRGALGRHPNSAATRTFLPPQLSALPAVHQIRLCCAPYSAFAYRTGAPSYPCFSHAVRCAPSLLRLGVLDLMQLRISQCPM